MTETSYIMLETENCSDVTKEKAHGFGVIKESTLPI